MNPTSSAAERRPTSLLRRALRWAGYGLGAVAALLVLGAGTLYAISQHRIQRVHRIEARPVAVVSNEETIARGRHLAFTRGCIECHDTDFGGKPVIEDAMVGRIHGPNLTRGLGGVPDSHTDLDFVRAIRHGVNREGHALLVMPSLEYTHMSDEDLGALIAFLRSIPPINRARGPVSPGPVAHALIALGQLKVSAEVIDHSAPRLARIEATPTSEYGAYLAASCMGCHGSNLSGGRIPGTPPDWPASANLTPHASGRLASWSESDFVTVLRTRKRPDGTELHPLMPAVYSQLTDVETRALWLYLQTLPPVATGQR